MKFEPKTDKELAESGLYTDGIYDIEVYEAQEKTSTKGNDMIELNIIIHNNDGGFKKIFDYLSPAFMAHKLKHAAQAFGLETAYENGELRAEDFVGKSGRAHVFIQIDKDGKYPNKNAIKDYVTGEGKKLADEVTLNDEIPF